MPFPCVILLVNVRSKMTVDKPTHRQHMPYHDYKARCIYHVTLVCSDRAKVLGRIVGDSVANACCELTPLGVEVARAIQGMPGFVAKKGGCVQILAAVCMPEHVHFVLYVKERMLENVGVVIRGFKQGCNKALRRWLEMSEERYGGSCEGCGDHKMVESPNGKTDDGMRMAGMGRNTGMGRKTSIVREAGVRGEAGGSSAFVGWGPFSPSGIDAFLRQLASLSSERIKRDHALFEPDYDETRLRRKRQLRAMIDYVHKNPRHRWLKQHYPGWLVPMRGIVIAGRRYDAIGNANLLGLPRWQVHVRRAWGDEERRGYMNDCVRRARGGYALVSPFISEHEAKVRDFCLAEGHSVLVLVDNGFSEYAQCPGGLYDYCVNGQVLVLAPSELKHEDRKGSISRDECVWLNGLAEDISGEV